MNVSRTNNFTGFLNTYEAYKIPKDSEILKDAPESVETEDGCVLILTEEASKQMAKDKEKVSEMLMADVQLASAKSQTEGAKKYGEDMGKILEVFRLMSKGVEVPQSDEKKLMEFDDDMYQAAKNAQMMARLRAKQKEKAESQWDEEEEAEFRKKMDELNKNVEDATQNMSTGMHEFTNSQIANIVPIETSSEDIAAIDSIASLGGGVAGARVDFTI
ncbi:MAG: hypothetical protein E7258_10090 [Lachnospiraceae bacterium]|nr:hypothetical protein [Lachnospiraceae bacterium]